MDIRKLKKFSPSKNFLEGKNILVTGAGSGIGREVAVAAAQYGANLILLSKDVKKLYSIQNEISENYNLNPLVIEFDFLKAKGIDYQKLGEALYEEYDKLDGIAHIAGILGYLSPLISTSENQLQTVMRVNFESNFLLTQICLPLLLQAKYPSVIFTSSGVGRKGRAFWTSYSISKFAVEGLMQVMADEYENKMKINSYNPGATKTAMRAQAFPAEDPLSLKTPADRAMDYLWLLSDENNSTGIAYDFSE
ncbi:MAG: YciK family oxidoreductase [Proteobacteria bacterium]|nr:YciK family oxidoreductase [Pseudomonadota bacterium]MDA0900044.1 YciK family oxidoreductase [Pseudomonadota bacterium]MDA1056827.1 YciK family oxidoreductase [Pseudomonadota bacterium]